MLPGFRFLFAAIVLSMSILVFGLGAAALLRAAHEEFANLPLRRAPPEPVFARQNDDPMPTLALLRVDLPVAEEPVDDVPAAAAPEIAPDILAPAAQALDDASPAEPETLATVSPEEPVQAEAAKPETPATETITETPAAPAETAPRCQCRSEVRRDRGNAGASGSNRPAPARTGGRCACARRQYRRDQNRHARRSRGYRR